MEKINLLKVRAESLQKALKKLAKADERLGNIKNQDFYEPFRESQIQSFEFSTDSFWKFLKEYLFVVKKVVVEEVTPRAVFQKALDAAIITKNEYTTLLEMVDARNMTSHTYNEVLADAISKKIPMFPITMQAIVERAKF